MADSWQTAWVEVVPEFSSSFRRAANSEMTSVLGSAGTAGGAVAGQNMSGGILGSIPKLAGPLLAAFAALGIGKFIGEAIGNGIRFGIEGIDLASGLAEQQNAVQVAFGAISDDILALSKEAPQNLNLTEAAFDQLAVRFSSFSKTIAGDGGDAAKIIQQLTQRGADFASVYDIEASAALELFQSGLAGETEPLRKFGVDLSAATTASFAYANGIAETGKELTEQQKIQARYGSLIAQTQITEGDLANTSGSLANQQRQLAVAFETAQTKLGTALLPTMLLFTQLANDTLIPILNDVIEQVGPQLATALAESAPAFVELVQAVAPLLPDLVSLAVAVLPPLLSLFTLLAQDTTAFFGTVTALGSWIAGDTSFADFQTTLGGLSGVFGFVVQAVNNGYMAIVGFDNGVRSVVGSLGSFIGTIPSTILSAIGNLGSLLVSSGRALIQGFIDGINAMLAPITGVMNFVASFFPNSPADRGPFSGSGWTRIYDSGAAVVQQFSSGLNAAPSFNGSSLVALPRLGGMNSLEFDETGGGSATGAFPEQVTLLDANGSILGVMDVKVGRYDNSRYQKTRGGLIWPPQ